MQQIILYYNFRDPKNTILSVFVALNLNYFLAEVSSTLKQVYPVIRVCNGIYLQIRVISLGKSFYRKREGPTFCRILFY